MTISDRRLSEWQQLLKSELDAQDKSIDARLVQAKLKGDHDRDEIKNEVFISITQQVESGKIRIQQSDDAIHFFTVKPQQEEQIYSLRAYLRTCLFNQIREISRCKRKEQQVDIDNSKTLIYQISQDSSLYRNHPENWIREREIREKMNQLCLEDRRILEMFYFQGLSFIEMAKQLEAEGFPLYKLENLRKKKERALEKLRQRY
jgi:RNA polymerase sigma factor (sigma-70 family)